MHISIPVSDTMEFINATKISPLISKVQIKVCYVGQQPNRNGSVITKEVATKLGENLPGCPIVGYYNEQKQDFEGHNKEVIVNNGEFKIVDMTKPYGFVDIGAKVWFEKFLDDGVEHEYLVTEGYLWTEIYEESKRVSQIGNNQSMELNDDAYKGFWANDDNSGQRIFIISDGLIEKLCILGEDIEPCFEGSQIKSHFSLDVVDFKNKMFSMINELKVTLDKGGSQTNMDENKNINLDNPNDEESKQFEKKKEEDEKSKEQEKDSKDKKEEDEKDKKKGYNLTDIAEYVSLQLQYSNLQTDYTNLQKNYNKILEENKLLNEFKLSVEKKEKQAMIDSFYMLSDKDKQDVIDHIDTYSLKDIESELSILCVRNRVNFNLENETPQKNNLTFNLNSENNNDDGVPAWVKAVKAKEV